MAKNLFGTDLKPCCFDPLTGFYRDGSCNTGSEDVGMHTVCAKVTDEFLSFSKSRGNDLSTPVPEFNFRGLKSGDKWCLCLLRWIEALESGMAPLIDMEATHISVLEHVELETLKKYALNSD